MSDEKRNQNKLTRLKVKERERVFLLDILNINERGERAREGERE